MKSSFPRPPRPDKGAQSVYSEKSNDYFDYVRHDALSLIPESADRVLEIGCGSGNTLAWLKANRGCSWVGGAEIFAQAAEEARGKLDAVFQGDVETMSLPLEEASLDAILCLDVLEHMVDPWEVVQRLHALLKPGGVLVASVPNVRHFRVVLPLVLRGKWEYANSGLLDKTHLRFFVRETAVKLLESSGLHVDAIEASGLGRGTKARLANTLTLSLLKPFFEYQYLVRARNGR